MLFIFLPRSNALINSSDHILWDVGIKVKIYGAVLLSVQRYSLPLSPTAKYPSSYINAVQVEVS